MIASFLRPFLKVYFILFWFSYFIFCFVLDESRLQGNRLLKSSRESLQSGATFSARRGSNASVYDGKT